MRCRSMALVVRERKILMEKLIYNGRTFYSIPGGGIEDGECLWQRIFETPQKFSRATADETACYLTGGGITPMYMAVVYATGDMREMYRLQFPDNVYIIGLATDAGALTMTGYLYNEEKLFYFEMR